MSATRFVALLTVLNLALLGVHWVKMPPAHAQAEPGMIRGTGFELVDAEGRVRVQMKLEPANPDFQMPDGSSGYPETVIFRLITADGKPRVKLTTSEEGSGLLLLGDTDASYSLLRTHRADSSLKLLNEGGAEQVIRP
jgi:hypothetical protein